MSDSRIGFVGGGMVARWHADVLASFPRATVAAIADIDAETRDEFTDAYDVDGAFEDYETMLEECDLDVVVVAVPNALHADVAVAALERGVHAFVEKPLADDLTAAERIRAAERESDATVAVGFMRPFESNVARVKEALDDGEFGEVYEVDLEYVRRRGIPAMGSWFTDPDAAGGGAAVDIGVHMLHLALHLLEFPAVETVSATTGAHFGGADYTSLKMWGEEAPADPDFDVEDHARALIRTADGATVHLNCAWASNREKSHRVRLLGDEAGVTLPLTREEATFHSTNHGGLSEETVEFPELAYDEGLEFHNAGSFTAQWRYFLRVVAGEREHTRNTVDEGIAVQRVLEALYRSADERREVRLDDLDVDVEAGGAAEARAGD